MYNKKILTYYMTANVAYRIPYVKVIFLTTGFHMNT